ncbi:MAG: GDSL-type esterase/lipase family protein, partial [Thermoanaerobaculia bacterium]
MRRLLLITAGCLAVAVVPLSAATEFVAMGDSITAGSSWPFSVESVFDCTGECSYGPSGENCGHVRRLDSWIDGWLGAGNHVVNEGVGAERTAAAVVRLPGVLDSQCPDSPGDCVAVILMHGTNDMCCSGVSPETARDNLGFMIDEAKSRNIDTLLMTVIRKVYAPNHNKWKTYKNLTLALAGTKNLQSVNPWLTLCAGTTCFNNKYWVDHPNSQCTAPGEGDGDIGHLDPNGYNDLTDLIKAVFPAAAPAAAVPTAPTGDLTDTQPDFVWPEVGETRWYELDVDGATTWWEAAVYCTGGTCTVDPGVGLAKGAHSWRVRGRNLRGMGAWSADTPFTVWGIPGTPVPSDPAGQFFDPTPTSAPFGWEPYTWSEDPEATDYDLVVSDGGGPVLTQSFDSSICISTCEASPGQGLGADSHTWTVQARNPGVSGPVSGSLAFEIFDSAP